MNNQYVAESLDWQTHPTHDIKKYLQVGDNSIAVAVKNEAGQGGLGEEINLEIIQNRSCRRGRAVCSTALRKSLCNLQRKLAKSS